MAQESKKDQANLELPDVIVYGLETGFREAGEKLSVSQVAGPSTSQNEFDPYSPFPPTADSLTHPSLQQTLSTLSTSVSAYGGPYSSWGLRAAHSSRLKGAGLRLFADLEDTDGEYTNSGGSWGEIEGRINGPLSNSVTGELQAGYRRWSYGVYDADDLQGKSRQENFTITSLLQTNHSERTSSRIGFGFQRFRYAFPFDCPDRLEDLYRGDLLLRTGLGSADIASTVHWTGDRPSWESQSSITEYQGFDFVHPSPAASDLAGGRVEVSVPLSSQVSATAGGEVQFFSRDDQRDQTRFFPRAKFLYRPAVPVAIHVSVEGGFRPYSLASLFEENPYGIPTVYSMAEEVRWHIEAGGEVEIRPGLMVKGAYGWTQLRNDLFWRWTAHSDLYSNNSLDEVRRHRVDISGVIRPNTDVKIEAGFSHLEYDVVDDLFLAIDPSADIPFHPKNRAWGDLTWRLPGIVDIRGDGQWIGERTFNLPSVYESYYNPEKLDAYFLLNLTLEKQVQDHMTLFTSLYNLLDSRYEVWYNYPEMGFTVHGGVKVVF